MKNCLSTSRLLGYKQHLLVILICLLFCVAQAVATVRTVTSAKSGKWNDVTTWIGGTIPGMGGYQDEVIIAANHTITVPSPTVPNSVLTASCENIEIKANARLIIQGSKSILSIRNSNSLKPGLVLKDPGAQCINYGIIGFSTASATTPNANPAILVSQNTTFTNSSCVNIQGPWNIGIKSDGTFINQGFGTFSEYWDQTFTFTYEMGIIINVSANTSTGIYVASGLEFINEGDINISFVSGTTSRTGISVMPGNVFTNYGKVSIVNNNAAAYGMRLSGSTFNNYGEIHAIGYGIYSEKSGTISGVINNYRIGIDIADFAIMSAITSLVFNNMEWANLYVGAALTNNNVKFNFSAPNNTVTYVGAGGVPIKVPADGYYWNLALNLTGTGKADSLTANITVKNQLILTSGVLNLSGKVLSITNVLGSGPSAGISGGCDTAYIKSETSNSRVIWNLGNFGFYTFPFGVKINGKNYFIPVVLHKINPGTLISPTTIGKCQVSTWHTNANNQPLPAGTIMNSPEKAADRFWKIDLSGYSLATGVIKVKSDVTFSYPAPELCGAPINTLKAKKWRDSDSLWVAPFDNASWTIPAIQEFISSSPSGVGTVKVSNINQFSLIPNQSIWSLFDVQPTIAAAGADQGLCDETTTTLEGNMPNVGAGTWTVISGTATIANATSPTSAVTVTSGSTVRLKWTIANEGITSTDDMVITVSVLPTQPYAGPNQTLCSKTYATVTGNTPSTGSGTWSIYSGAGAVLAPNSATTMVTGLMAGPTILYWTITNGACSISDDVVINTFLPDNAYAGIDQGVSLPTATLSGNAVTQGNTGTWSVVSGPATITDPTSPTSTVTGLVPEILVTLRWTVIFNSPLCPNSATGSADEVYLIYYPPSAFKKEVSTGANEDPAENSPFSMYPNPTNGMVELMFDAQNNAECQIEITNTLGQVVAKENLKELTGRQIKTFDLTPYGKGIYFITLSNNGWKRTNKLIVN